MDPANKWVFGIYLERYSPSIIGLGAAVACWLGWGSLPLPGSWKELVAAVFTAAATGAGFLFTAASIIISLNDRPIIKWGRDTEAYPMFVGYLTGGVWWCSFTALVTLVMFFPDFSKVQFWHRWMFFAWGFAAAGAATAIVRVLLILGTILKQAASRS